MGVCKNSLARSLTSHLRLHLHQLRQLLTRLRLHRQRRPRLHLHQDLRPRRGLRHQRGLALPRRLARSGGKSSPVRKQATRLPLQT